MQQIERQVVDIAQSSVTFLHYEHVSVPTFSAQFIKKLCIFLNNSKNSYLVNNLIRNVFACVYVPPSHSILIPSRRLLSFGISFISPSFYAAGKCCHIPLCSTADMARLFWRSNFPSQSLQTEIEGFASKYWINNCDYQFPFLYHVLPSELLGNLVVLLSYSIIY